VTTTVSVGAVPPAVNEDRVQVTTPETWLQVQPVPVADPNVTPAGSVSVTDRLAASLGPALATTREYVTDPAAVTDAGPDLVIDRSAEAVTDVLADAELLPGTGSVVELVTDAVLVIEPAWAGAVTTIVIVGAVAPLASEVAVHVTTPEAWLHVHPVPDADPKLTPAGNVSVTDTLAASLGPALATTRE
jgi:hypothetical protein